MSSRILLWFDDKMKWTILTLKAGKFCLSCGLMTKWNERYWGWLVDALFVCCGLMTKWNERYCSIFLYGLKISCGLMTKWNERYWKYLLGRSQPVVVWWQNEMNDIPQSIQSLKGTVVVWWQNEMNDIFDNRTKQFDWLWFDDKMKWTIFVFKGFRANGSCGLMTKWNERY